MKGYQMILLVNAALLLLVAIGLFLMTREFETQAARCAADPSQAAASCARFDRLADGSQTWAPVFLSGGILLLGLGAAVAWLPERPPRTLE